MRNDIAIVALKYLEPEYVHTVKCIEETGLDVYWADRDGVGSMRRAFNDAFSRIDRKKYKYAWFLTNITFRKEVPFLMAGALDDWKDVSAIHPAFNSDHPFLRPINQIVVETVPFIELTAPMFRVSAFRKRFLCEQTPYWFM